MVIEHRSQQTATSCGVTCVMMIADSSFQHVAATLKRLRSAARKHKRSYGMNVAEMMRTLAAYGFDVADRVKLTAGVEPRMSDGKPAFGVVRVHVLSKSGKHRRGWHWVLLADNTMHDPLMFDPMDADVWFTEATDHKLFFYAVTRREDSNA